ncbi:MULTISPECIES: hypothetical protein [Arthrobacter]|uniref:hypothetical protein n=1 Tax=unclassified Arthrobacter TaxID=235627 RepID=UPI0024B9D1C7|nr:hypothetical protein [Arthrobacter sp. H35-MC1]MDJ0317084.1 hypothetical protein [Arthrobacter sp. H35-MC1]
MVSRPPLPAALGRRSFTYEEGLSAGATLSRMRAKDLSSPSRQVRVPRGESQNLLDRVRPYIALCDRGCISHVTAAQLHGMPLPWFEQDIKTVHITRPAASVQPRRKHIIGHSIRLPGEDIMDFGGVPVTTPARTFLDLGHILDLQTLVAVADFLICAHNRHFEPPKLAIISAAELRAYIASKHNVRGLTKARAAVELMRVGVDSPRETRLRLLLQRAGLPTFTTNYSIAGDPPVAPDLACEEYKTCAEYEGDIHKTSQKQLFDRNRDVRTAARGWQQVKVYKSDMQRGDAFVIAMVAKALKQQGWHPG